MTRGQAVDWDNTCKGNTQDILDGTWLRHGQTSEAGIIDKAILDGSHTRDDIAHTLAKRFPDDWKQPKDWVRRIHDHEHHLKGEVPTGHNLRLVERGGILMFDIPPNPPPPDLSEVLKTDAAIQAIQRGRLDFPGSDLLKDWNTIPFGVPSPCKDKLVVFVTNGSLKDTVLGKALEHFGVTSCYGVTILVLFYVLTNRATWGKVWQLYEPAFRKLEVDTGIRIGIEFSS